jgi:NADP-dependent 3-hydroxy acid dehydrogenase YdfG
MSADDLAASTTASAAQRERDLLGQTVLVIGGSSGIGLATARLARANGAEVILTARDPDRLHRVGLELKASIAAFDATDFDRLERFFDALPPRSTTCWSPAPAPPPPP